MTRDARIDEYIAAARPFARPILEKIRERVHAVVPDAEETMKWSMPTYLVGGKILLLTAAFRAHAALNFWRGRELRGEALDVESMSQFGRIKSLAQLPPDCELDQLIGAAVKLAATVPPRRKPRHVPKPRAQMHPEFAEALSRAPKSKAVLEGFPASAQRDYLEWIAEAKQEGTRRKRIATALEWLSEGKRRHWKYERC